MFTSSRWRAEADAAWMRVDKENICCTKIEESHVSAALFIEIPKLPLQAFISSISNFVFLWFVQVLHALLKFATVHNYPRTCWPSGRWSRHQHDIRQIPAQPFHIMQAGDERKFHRFEQLSIQQKPSAWSEGFCRSTCSLWATPALDQRFVEKAKTHVLYESTMLLLMHSTCKAAALFQITSQNSQILRKYFLSLPLTVTFM